jgi:hypothetical protein
MGQDEILRCTWQVSKHTRFYMRHGAPVTVVENVTRAWQNNTRGSSLGVVAAPEVTCERQLS